MKRYYKVRLFLKAVFLAHVSSASQSADLNIPDVLKQTIDSINKKISHLANRNLIITTRSCFIPYIKEEKENKL